ncbi:hypothetical protein QBC46DRAFT_394318 [Diplogelasinospora grovesii]|uniref:Atos-like conserved domain-containing protein n=1 Tax=Diplogelasinospora grovesii TaxID=303347 RepID=A0AAN6N0H2_9PEZI|nr:hypothetical protein QBC46DRAFT_394318 [Diplogelasinospora grovesii]
MPMFQEHLEPQDRAPDETTDDHPEPTPIQASTDIGLTRRASEESIRTEFCEGPVLESPPKPTTKPTTPEKDLSNTVSDRAELIERLKRGESPTWIPARRLESLFRPPSATPQSPTRTSASLLPAANVTPEKQDGKKEDAGFEARAQEGLNIERPRSALHSGNFTPEESSPQGRDGQDAAPQEKEGNYTSRSTAWIATSPPRGFANFGRGEAPSYRREAFKSGASSLSSSISSSFVYRPPTSPLVQSESNEDMDLSFPIASIDIANSPRNNPRRHTLFSQSSPYAPLGTQRQIPSVRREGTYPYQAHQPRRSLNSTPSFSFAGTSPQTPALLRSRRPSYSSEQSPLQHASMVGSYEESILRGRMSTTPSRPLDFMAQIGVLGLGKCKSSLRCPAHVTLPFSAVFYSYASTVHGRTKMEDGPSPYVGQIDLENGLPNPEEEQRNKRKLQTRFLGRKAGATPAAVEDDDISVDVPEEGEDRKHSKKRSRSPKAPPGGRYRIPEKGQLQIIIKNQNKTAVKLFLVPYDLAGMEPGTKTFIRQRSYSAGPIVDIPELKEADGTADRPILRYLIHLHICCSSKGRFYLYKSIRVVFANRVPDGKERLRNEVTYPEPRFTPYKPIRVMHPPLGQQVSGPGAMLAAEQANRRRSSGYAFANFHPQQQPFDLLTDEPLPMSMDVAISIPTSVNNMSVDEPLISGLLDEEPTRRGSLQLDNSNSNSSVMSGLERTTTPSGIAQDIPGQQLGKYDKLSKGDVGYGGNAFAPSSWNGGSGGLGAVSEGLLSQCLKSLGVARNQEFTSHAGDGAGSEETVRKERE